MDARQFARRDAPQRFAHGHGFQRRILGDQPVKLLQERPAIQFVMLPGVLAVQDDRHQRVAPLRVQ
jgi:hypothetical protein